MSGLAVILVHTTSHAIRAERVLERAGFEVKLIPTPRYLGSDCGSAVRIRACDRAACREELQRAGVPLDRVESLDESRL